MRPLRFTQRVEPSRPLFALMAAGLLAACAEPEDRTSRAQDDDDEEAGSQVQAAKSVVAPRADGRAAHYVVFEGPSAIAAARGLTGAAKTARIREVAAQLRAQHDPVRARIEAAGGIVVADLVLVANAMQVRVPPEALRAVRAMPMVTGLEAPTVHHASLAEAVPLLGATEVWQSASGLHGQGVRIGVIDTGIDYTHADLGGRGDPDNYDDNDRDVIEAGTFPTLKVIGGRDLAGDAYDASAFLGDPVPSPDADPLDCSGHGTHVAAIAAGTGVSDDGTPYVGPYDVSLEPGAFAIHPGAAPRASLFAIKIFGCTGSTDLVLPAFELAADPNEDGDTSDRLDVLNLSLGGSFAGRPRSEVELAAVAALTEAGTLVVASAGNTPVASFAVGYPASQPAALAVAATLKELAQYSFAGVEVTAPAATAGIYPLGLPNSAPGLAQIDGFSGQAVVAEPDLACEALTNGGDLAGKVAIVRDGVCDVVDKVAHAADAGAVAVLVVDNEHWNLPGPILGPHALPTFGVRRAEGEALIAASPLSVSFDAASTVVVELGPDYVAPFSSRGPTADEARLKPDLAVPGQDILSAQVGTGASGQVRSGTSMATPLAAGAAALLRQARPELGPLEVKELLTSSAKAVAGPLYRFPATLAGAGRLQIDDAIAATISARMEGTEGETGVSFGSIVASSDHTETRTVVVTNRRATSVTLDLEIEPALEWPGMTVSVSPSSVVVPAGESATVELSLGISPDSLPPAPVYPPYTRTRGAVTLEGGVSSVATVLYAESSGRLVVRDGASDEAAVVSYYGIARAGAERAVASVDGCIGAAGATLTLGGAAAVHDNATSVLELGTTTSSFSDPRGPNAAKDLVATGALANPETDHVYFGVVTEGDWVTPARGFFSEVGIEVDTDGDASADHLVVAESFDHPDPASPFSTVAHNGPYARVLDIATGELSQTFEPLNGTHPAYPGGSFDGSEAHDTQIYFNRVLVFPVRLSALGLSEGETFSYRAVSAVSRSPALVGLPLPTPMDATDWVSFDVSVPRLALPGCFDGTPLCPGGEDAIELRLDGGEDTLPTLLVLHHSNASAARFETVDLAEANLFGNDIAITAGATAAVEVGEEAVSTFTVTNGGGADAIAVTASLEVTGGAIASAEASAGTCSTTTCDLGSIGAGESVTITVVATASAAGSLVVTSRVASACGTETGNDEAVASFEVGGGPAAATSSSGAGPTGSASASGSGGGSEGSGGSGGGGERASDDGCGCRMIPRSGPRGVAHGVGLMGAALALRRLRRRGGKS